MTHLPPDKLPHGEFGLFLASRSAGLVQPPGSQGPLCLGGGIGRFNQPHEILIGPQDSIEVDLTAFPMNPWTPVLAGETWYFQCWYRDGSGASNFSDALSVTFT